MTFPLAPMCRVISVLTFVLLAIPLGFIIGAALGYEVLLVPGLMVAVIYVWVWTRFRPTMFVVHPQALEIVWPLKRRELSRDHISAVRLMTRADLRREIGWGMRVGAGGLWGGFGWLWSARRGIVQMYISRLDRFVWVERGHERPWLITPDRADAFVRALS
jgi:PH (Pleckstrin Homology) domain-containing protein